MAARDVVDEGAPKPSSRGRGPASANGPSSRRSSGGPGSGPGRFSALEERYRSLFLVGRGGMGTVEAALEVHTGAPRSDEGGYDRVVALKRLLPDSARDTRRVEMFLREARLAARLDHPNVVRAYDYGEIDGELFLAMEYVEGQPLSRVLRALADAHEGGLPPSLAAHLLAEVCEGLHAAHELAGEDGKPLLLVHRDVSPQNVMLGYDGHVRLLDFGVAKIEAESVTKTGEVKGKTAYMSPEQAMGDAIDRRSDLFGVGAMLFECLTLGRMWGDGTDMEVIRKLALEEPPELASAAKDAPSEMCALYKRLVAREAQGRPGTAREVAEELRTMVPDGAEAAARALAEMLAKHFGEQAEEQRRRLAEALDDVAPTQARELRESVLPRESERPSLGLRARDDSGHETSEAPASTPGSAPGSARAEAASATAPARSRGAVVAAALVVAALGIVGWRVAAPGIRPQGGPQDENAGRGAAPEPAKPPVQANVSPEGTAKDPSERTAPPSNAPIDDRAKTTGPIDPKETTTKAAKDPAATKPSAPGTTARVGAPPSTSGTLATKAAAPATSAPTTKPTGPAPAPSSSKPRLDVDNEPF